MIAKIYWVLSLAVKDNPRNKKYMNGKLYSVFLEHLKAPETENLNVELFLSQTILNNESLLIDISETKQLTEVLVRRMDEVSPDNINRAVVVKCLEHLLKFNSTVIRTNQDLVIDQVFYKRISK